jgi:ubiquinone/menaquinone biosynthesis C-methylase UbiE
MADRVCPWWVGYLLASPIRKLVHDPRSILEAYVKSGMTALDIGCAMGFFSLPLARLAGPRGKIICLDLQQKMLDSLRKRARKAGLLDRLELRVSSTESLGLKGFEGSVDFALAFAVVHEVASPSGLFGEIYQALKPDAQLLVAEPSLHVSKVAFESSITSAKEAGFIETDRPRIPRSRAILFHKPGSG